jgi:hypothetical protein
MPILSTVVGNLQMLIQLQSQHLPIVELELIFFAVEVWIVLVDDAVVVRTNDNDVR